MLIVHVYTYTHKHCIYTHTQTLYVYVAVSRVQRSAKYVRENKVTMDTRDDQSSLRTDNMSPVEGGKREPPGKCFNTLLVLGVGTNISRLVTQSWLYSLSTVGCFVLRLLFRGNPLPTTVSVQGVGKHTLTNSNRFHRRKKKKKHHPQQQ